MLGPYFSEGWMLHRESKVAISLPDDNAKALIIMLSAMHLRYPDRIDAVTPGDLVNIAWLCDKYACRETVWPITHVMLNLSDHYACDGDYYSNPARAGDALAASAVLRDLTMTYKLGYSILGHSTQRIQCSPKGSSIMPLIGTDIFGWSEPFRNHMALLNNHLRSTRKPTSRDPVPPERCHQF